MRERPNRRMVELGLRPVDDEQPGLTAPNRLLRNEFSRQLKIKSVDFHPITPRERSSVLGERPSDMDRRATSALILHHGSDCMAETEQPTGTRGIEPAANPLPPTEGAPGEPAPVVVDVDAPIGIRNIPLAVLAVIAVILLLQYASPVFIPVTIAILISYSLSPSVTSLQKRGVPPAVGAAIVLLMLLALLGVGTYKLTDQVVQIVDRVPAAAHRLRDRVEAHQ